MAKEACTGLMASRNNTTMTFSWLLPVGKTSKKGQFRYKLITGGANPAKVKWTTVKLTGLTLMPTTTTITLDPTLYYPATDKTLVSIIWDVMMDGQKWAGDQTYEFTIPNKPRLTRSVDTYSWLTDQDSATNSIYFQDVEYQSTNSGSYASPDWSASSVTSGTGSSTGSQTYSSDNNGYRHFRCRVRGIAGPSEWVAMYKSHNVPRKSSDISCRLYKATGRVNVDFHLDKREDIDQALVYYAVDVPAAGFTCPVSATWNLAYTLNNPGNGWNSVEFSAAGVALDKAVWVRIDTYNSPNTTTGDVVLAGSCGLTAPTITGFTVDTVNKTVTFAFTNGSSVPGIFIGCRMSQGNKLIGSVAGTATTMTCKYGDIDADDVNFSLYAYYDLIATSDYVVQSIDLSKPLAPTSVSIAKTADAGKVRVSWTVNWSAANGTEISWSDDPDAWDSNLRPDTFIVENAATASFLIAGLSLGKYWYFRVRSVHLSEDGLEPDVYSPYNSALIEIDLTATPDAPAVWLDEEAIAPGDPVTVHWAYVSNDDTDQAKATIYIDNVATYDINSGVQSYTFTPSWANNTTHNIKVSTLSESGRQSSQSSAVTVNVAPALSLTVTSSIVGGQITAMPLTVTATGAGTGGKTMISIVRDGHYAAGRPDGGKADGFDGETIYSKTFYGPVSGLSIEPDDLVGRLDDGCFYKLVVAIASSIGQTAQSVTRFLVAWSHQPETPSATVTEITGGVAKINVAQPSNYTAGDYCQIYRLSKDKPELIIDGGLYATDYVDPYPAAGGGYRIVNLTGNGDYIGTDYPAWTDKTHSIKVEDLIIDFDDRQIILPYNLTLQSTWAKDFERTVYLNGSIQGDWNGGTTMDGTVGTVTLETDDERIEALRALAVYPGVCHVRTPDGASYAADVQVKQSGDYSTGLASFDLTIKRVDPQGTEGYLKSDWEDMQG